MVDEGRIAFSPAVELSYLTKLEQAELWDIMQSEDCTPSLSQAVHMKKLSKIVQLTPEMIFDIMSEEKANQKERVRIDVSQLRKYFPKSYTTAQMEKNILRMLEEHHKKKQRNKEVRLEIWPWTNDQGCFYKYNFQEYFFWTFYVYLLSCN